MKNIRISAEAFLQGLKDKPVAICGIGHNNLPVIRQFYPLQSQNNRLR